MRKAPPMSGGAFRVEKNKKAMISAFSKASTMIEVSLLE